MTKPTSGRRMSHPAPGSVAKAGCVLAGCLVVAGSAAHLATGSAQSPEPTGLTATTSGAAFDHAHRGGQNPTITLRGLAAGEAASGAVTVSNPGSGSRWYWLSQAALSEHAGIAGRRLYPSLRLTVLDVTDVHSPATVYRGRASDLGARPLGFLAPGASRTYSFTVALPPQSRRDAARHRDPYRGAGATIAYGWRAIAALPGPGATQARPPRRPRRGGRAPHVRFDVVGGQRVLASHSVALRSRCTKPCRMHSSASVTSAGKRWNAAVIGTGGIRRSRTVRVRLGPKAMASIRSATLARKQSVIRVRARVRDRAGNGSRTRYRLRLKPQG